MHTIIRTICILRTIEKYDTIKAHAEVQGESLNAFINRAITETMERDGAATED